MLKDDNISSSTSRAFWSTLQSRFVLFSFEKGRGGVCKTELIQMPSFYRTEGEHKSHLPAHLKDGEIKEFWKMLVPRSKPHICSCPLSCPCLAQSGPIWLQRREASEKPTVGAGSAKNLERNK